MICVTPTAARHPFADGDAAHTAPDLDHRACGAVADRRLLVELLAYGSRSREHAFRLHLSDDLFHEVGSLYRLGDKGLS
jgi:hypothetical protein